MSNATLAVYGRLGSATRTGKPMATASLAVSVPDRSGEADRGRRCSCLGGFS